MTQQPQGKASPFNPNEGTQRSNALPPFWPPRGELQPGTALIGYVASVGKPWKPTPTRDNPEPDPVPSLLIEPAITYESVNGEMMCVKADARTLSVSAGLRRALNANNLERNVGRYLQIVFERVDPTNNGMRVFRVSDVSRDYVMRCAAAAVDAPANSIAAQQPSDDQLPF